MLIALLMKKLADRLMYVPHLTAVLETTVSHLSDKEKGRQKVKAISFHIAFLTEVKPKRLGELQ